MPLTCGQNFQNVLMTYDISMIHPQLLIDTPRLTDVPCLTRPRASQALMKRAERSVVLTGHSRTPKEALHSVWEMRIHEKANALEEG